MSGQTATRPMVKAEAVSKSYGSNEVLKSISLEVKRGQVLCLVGPAGSGKSTFLRCINHLETINAGRLWVDRLSLAFGAGWAAAACAGIVAGVIMTSHFTADAQADAVLYQASLLGMDDTELLG